MEAIQGNRGDRKKKRQCALTSLVFYIVHQDPFLFYLILCRQLRSKERQTGVTRRRHFWSVRNSRLPPCYDNQLIEVVLLVSYGDLRVQSIFCLYCFHGAVNVLLSLVVSPFSAREDRKQTKRRRRGRWPTYGWRNAWMRTLRKATSKPIILEREKRDLHGEIEESITEIQYTYPKEDSEIQGERNTHSIKTSLVDNFLDLLAHRKETKQTNNEYGRYTYTATSLATPNL